MSFGQELQLERQRRDISLEAIAEGTKVPTRHLRALEQEKFDLLPGGVFNKGIVRSYCRYVGLDEGEWLQRFPVPPELQPEPDWASFAENVRRNRQSIKNRTRLRWLGVVVMLLMLAGLAYCAWHFVLAPRMAASPEASHTSTAPQRSHSSETPPS